jgi:hypothetical protein
MEVCLLPRVGIAKKGNGLRRHFFSSFCVSVNKNYYLAFTEMVTECPRDPADKPVTAPIPKVF